MKNEQELELEASEDAKRDAGGFELDTNIEELEARIVPEDGGGLVFLEPPHPPRR